MLTLKKHPDNVEICKLKVGKGKKTVPVFWHPVRNKDLRLSVTDVNTFNSELFRDRFRLSKGQADEIIAGIKNDTTPEGSGLHQKYFKVKKYIEDSLYNEMDLLGSQQEIELCFPPGNDTWCGNSLVCGASSSGKTWHVVSQFKKNLEGPEKDRRQFLIISNEWQNDKTLSQLKENEKYRPYITGIDVSERSLQRSQHDSAQSFFDEEVRPHLEFADRGTVVFLDDPCDACCHKQLRHTINRMLRTSRHDDVSLMFVLHRIASGIWSSQANSSCKFFVLFPRSQRGKCRDFLNKVIGLTLSESREIIHNFSQAGRAMTVRLFSPQCIMTKKRLQLI
jgi:hypothetical protein